jgi:hypothetical protein
MPALLLKPFVRAETLRVMQRARHVEAILLLDAGDTLGWYRLMGDVAAFGEQFRLSLKWAKACAERQWQ